MSDLQREASATDEPRFETTLRGYNKDQVDTFVRVQAGQLTEEQRRAERAETASAQLQRQLEAIKRKDKPTFEELGAEAARIIQNAGQSAEAIANAARGRAAEIVEEAEKKAAQLLEEAAKRVAQADEGAKRTAAEAAAQREKTLAAAQAEAKRVRDAAAGEQRKVQAETSRISEGQERMRSDLDRIRGEITKLLDAPEKPAAEKPAAAAAAAGDQKGAPGPPAR